MTLFAKNFGLVVVAVLLTVLVSGCMKVEKTGEREASLPQDEVEQVLAVVIDLSGSFHGEWKGRAYPFLREVIGKYFHESMGSESRLMIGRLSENNDPMFWSGTPRDFVRTFPDEEAFLDRLERENTAIGSPVYRSVAASIECVESMPRIGSTSKVTLMVLSDLEDNVVDRKQRNADAHRLLDAVKRFTADGCNLAVYYASVGNNTRWMRTFKKHNIDLSRVWMETNLASSPTVPDFY